MLISFERRLKKLEQIREKYERPAVMHILFAGCEDHFGHFVVTTGGRKHIVEREPDEAWHDFQLRVDPLASGTLRLLIFAPITPEGKPILADIPETP
jgi:hypothetical protein